MEAIGGFSTSLCQMNLSLHPFKDPCSLLTSQRRRQVQAAPLGVPVLITWHPKGDGRGLAALETAELIGKEIHFQQVGGRSLPGREDRVGL
jgi:hypothetical protein